MNLIIFHSFDINFELEYINISSTVSSNLLVNTLFNFLNKDIGALLIEQSLK